MISEKLSYGNGFAGLAGYLNKEGSYTLESNMLNGIDDPRAFAREMRSVSNKNDRVKNPVGHTAFSFGPDDSGKPIETLELAVRMVCDEMGYTQNRQYHIEAHNDNVNKFGGGKGNLDFHCCYNTVDFDGKRLNDSLDYSKLMKATRKVEKELGLTITVSKAELGEQNLKTPKYQQEKFKKTNIEQPHNYIQRMVDVVGKQSDKDMLKFIQGMEKMGVEVKADFRGENISLSYKCGDYAVKASEVHGQQSKLEKKHGIEFNAATDKPRIENYMSSPDRQIGEPKFDIGKSAKADGSRKQPTTTPRSPTKKSGAAPKSATPAARPSPSIPTAGGSSGGSFHFSQGYDGEEAWEAKLRVFKDALRKKEFDEAQAREALSLYSEIPVSEPIFPEFDSFMFEAFPDHKSKKSKFAAKKKKSAKKAKPTAAKKPQSDNKEIKKFDINKVKKKPAPETENSFKDKLKNGLKNTAEYTSDIAAKAKAVGTEKYNSAKNSYDTYTKEQRQFYAIFKTQVDAETVAGWKMWKNQKTGEQAFVVDNVKLLANDDYIRTNHKFKDDKEMKKSINKMLFIAHKKGWDLENLQISGSEKFVEMAQKQAKLIVAKIEKDKEENKTPQQKRDEYIKKEMDEFNARLAANPEQAEKARQREEMHKAMRNGEVVNPDLLPTQRITTPIVLEVPINTGVIQKVDPKYIMPEYLREYAKPFKKTTDGLEFYELKDAPLLHKKQINIFESNQNIRYAMYIASASAPDNVKAKILELMKGDTHKKDYAQQKQLTPYANEMEFLVHNSPDSIQKVIAKELNNEYAQGVPVNSILNDYPESVRSHLHTLIIQGGGSGSLDAETINEFQNTARVQADRSLEDNTPKP